MAPKPFEVRPGSATPATHQLSFFSGAGGLGAAVTAHEFLNAPGRIYELLFPREKRMTSSANTDSNIAARRARMIHRAARTDDVGFVIFGMNACFHFSQRALNLRALKEARKR